MVTVCFEFLFDCLTAGTVNEPGKGRLMTLPSHKRERAMGSPNKPEHRSRTMVPGGPEVGCMCVIWVQPEVTSMVRDNPMAARAVFMSKSFLLGPERAIFWPGSGQGR